MAPLLRRALLRIRTAVSLAICRSGWLADRPAIGGNCCTALLFSHAVHPVDRLHAHKSIEPVKKFKFAARMQRPVVQVDIPAAAER